MNFARFRAPDGAVLEGELVDGNLRTFHGDYAIDEVTLLAPCTPSKVICVGLNYRDHAEEIDMPLPDEPLLFFKPPSAVIGPNADIIRPTGVTRLDSWRWAGVPSMSGRASGWRPPPPRCW